MQHTTMICIAFMANIISSSAVQIGAAEPEAVELQSEPSVNMVNSTVHHQKRIDLHDAIKLDKATAKLQISDAAQPESQSCKSRNHPCIRNQASVQQSDILRDCSDIEGCPSGVYTIQPLDDSEPFAVYCDMDTGSGGWTVFQRRQDGRLDFFRYWSHYKKGFGHPAAEFWLGNDNIYRLTNQGRHYKLRVDLEDFEGETRYAEYDAFGIGDDFSQYKLILGEYSGDAGDSLSGHNGQLFSTRDRDNDIHDVVGVHCAMTYTGAWWYSACHSSNLNGQYLGGETEEYAKGIVWNVFKGYKYSLKHTEMKIRPVC